MLFYEEDLRVREAKELVRSKRTREINVLPVKILRFLTVKPFFGLCKKLKFYF